MSCKVGLIRKLKTKTEKTKKFFFNFFFSFASGGVCNYSSNHSPCDDGNTCHHECELEKLSNETSVWYNVWCHCFEGFEFTGEISSEGFE